MPLATPERGYPFVALAVLIVVIASPVISLGGTRSALLGLAVAALSICFLWLERLPLRPGLGVAGLLVVALVGALPVAAAADRGEPWFDYRSFAESLGPDDPVRFSWTQSYGPIDWPRDGNEVMRVVSGEPLYWKARNLDDFNGIAWQVAQQAPRTSPFDERFEADLPEDWADRPAWTETVEFNIKRMRTTDVIGAGTTVDVKDPSRAVREGLSPGTWDAPSALRRNDSYTAEVHVPRPGIVADVGGDHGRGRAPAGRARADPAVQAGRVRDRSPRRLLALEPGDATSRCTSRRGAATTPATPTTRRSTGPTATSTA